MTTPDNHPAVLYEKQDGVVLLTLNAPETKNALSEEMIQQLIAYCEQINADDDARCVILTGQGGSFCSGGNFKGMADKDSTFGQKPPAQFRRHIQGSIQRLTTTLYDLEVPIIAAVNGYAMGAGCDLTLMCDIRIASDTAVFSENFLQVGLIPGDGGAWLLPRVVGASRAYEMSFTCDRIPAAMAVQIGLASRVVAAADLMDDVWTMARGIAAKPPQTVRLTKKLIRDSMRLPLRESLELAASMQAIAQNTSDHEEAIRAMIEKRRPQFTGQ